MIVGRGIWAIRTHQTMGEAAPVVCSAGTALEAAVAGSSAGSRDAIRSGMTPSPGDVWGGGGGPGGDGGHRLPASTVHL